MAPMKQGLHVAGYRYGATFATRWGGYLSLVLLIGLVGGLSMGAVAAARRTQSSFATYLASTNPSKLGVTVFGGIGNGGGSAPIYSPSALEAIARLPGVRHVEAAIPIAAAPVAPDGAPRLGGINDIQPVASVDGLFFDQDRLAVTAGRMADPDRPDQIVMTASAAQLLGVPRGRGDPLRRLYRRQADPAWLRHREGPTPYPLRCHFGGPGPTEQCHCPRRHRPLPDVRLLYPRLGRRIVADGGQEGAITYGLQLDHGNGDVNLVEREFARARRPAIPTDFTPSHRSRPRSIERSSRWPSPSESSAGLPPSPPS